MNQLAARVWVLDTPVAFGLPNSVLWNGQVKVHHFEFVQYAAQGNKAILKDQTGIICSIMTGAADLEEVRTATVGWVNGLVLDTLDAGKVLVYLAP